MRPPQRGPVPGAQTSAVLFASRDLPLVDRGASRTFALATAASAQTPHNSLGDDTEKNGTSRITYDPRQRPLEARALRQHGAWMKCVGFGGVLPDPDGSSCPDSTGGTSSERADSPNRRTSRCTSRRSTAASNAGARTAAHNPSKGTTAAAAPQPLGEQRYLVHPGPGPREVLSPERPSLGGRRNSLRGAFPTGKAQRSPLYPSPFTSPRRRRAADRASVRRSQQGGVGPFQLAKVGPFWLALRFRSEPHAPTWSASVQELISDPDVLTRDWSAT